MVAGHLDEGYHICKSQVHLLPRFIVCLVSQNLACTMPVLEMAPTAVAQIELRVCSKLPITFGALLLGLS